MVSQVKTGVYPDTIAAHRTALRKRPRISETLIQGFLFLCGALSILVTVGIVYELGKESLLFFTRQQWEGTNRTLIEAIDATQTTFKITETGMAIGLNDTIRIGAEAMEVREIRGDLVTVARGQQNTAAETHVAGAEIELSQRVTLAKFFTKTEWNPQIGKFGIWALVNATMMTSLIAIVVALPLGLCVAIYLSEYASARVRSVLKPLLEVLAAIPTVVYGYFALMFTTPLLRAIFGVEHVEIYNTASAGIVIGILILPLVSSMAEDALSAVPQSLRQAAYGLGATRLETALRVVVPAAISGLAAAFIVAASRAIGETMVVAIAAGAGPAFTFNPFKAAETMTGHIVRISGGDLSYDSIDYNSIFAIGLMLFFITLGLNILSQNIVRRFREEYE
ncbi:MAG TPA: phosphate ABC transporter permease subunit PstC [Anaerolineae bacterium]|nr:phosphate ABC transporter permease subunit PstC [Anaerolineae bacterium]HQK15630.1 phosphate ABC transporter permease subunit PstC [Anaerolineae bacterium]